MPGFVLSIGKKVDFPPINRSHNFVVESMQGDGWCIERRTNRKFLDDKLFFENADFLIVTEGCVLNKTELMKQYASTSFYDCVIKMYLLLGETFFARFRGPFSGVLYDKRENRWLIYTNHIGDKKVFYSCFEGNYYIGSEMGWVVDMVGCDNLSVDEEGAYFLLTQGCPIEGRTLITEISLLTAGHYLVIENGKLTENEYHRFDNEPKEMTVEEAVEGIDKLFRKAVKLEWDKDLEYGYKHIGTLSAGLDSRMNVWVAHQMGYDKQLNFTFAQSGSIDFETAEDIANDLKHDWLFKSLSNGNCVYDIDSVTKLTYGNVVYFGLSHGKSIVDLINTESFGVFHTGQVGDAIIGTFFPTLAYDENVKFGYKTVSNVLLDRTKEYQLRQQYKNLELYLLYVRGLAMALQGNLSYQEYSEVCSPFCDVDFLEFCYSIPLELRFKHKIYIDWVLAKYPEAANYLWNGIKIESRTNSVPALDYSSNPNRFAERCLKKAKKMVLGNKVRSRKEVVDVSSKKDPFAMNPVEYWYNTNEDMRLFVDNYYENRKEIARKHLSKQMQMDLETLYGTDAVYDKFLVMSLLSALELMFGEQPM
jgi:asparagine synthase (glutamine-hydrolysing)